MIELAAQWLTPELLNTDLVKGVSVGFALIFFIPLAAVAALFALWCVFARRSVLGWAKALSTLWVLACVPASLLILMGAAFNSANSIAIAIIPFWVALGLAALWFPVALRWMFGIRPV